MGTQLNIKSEDAYRLASQLTALTGESLTAAVTIALQERLERQLQDKAAKQRDVAALTERILEIGRHCAAHIHSPIDSTRCTDELYGEDGLPI